MLLLSITNTTWIIIAAAALVVGLAVGYLITSTLLKKAVTKEETALLEEAKEKAEVIKKERILQAKEKFLQMKDEHEKACNERKRELQKTENRISQLQQQASQKMEEAQRKAKEVQAAQQKVEAQQESLNKKKSDLDRIYNEESQKLEAISGLSAKEAKEQLVELIKEDAKARLWEEILAACRVDGGDAVQNWKDHSDELQRHVQILNEYNFKELRYKNSAGTDVTVGLPEGHFWAGGEENGADGRPFSANIPTEEVFTLPKRDSINGTIVATKPLAHNGTLIEGFSFEVKDGKIVDVHAEKGEQILRDAISVDEGASYFGEVALVPHDSPISNSGILFMNTLFDENASCHFAFGEAYPNIYGAENMSEEELKERGANFSMTHVDFMVGSSDMTITGITHDGEEVPVFVNGNFAF